MWCVDVLSLDVLCINNCVQLPVSRTGWAARQLSTICVKLRLGGTRYYVDRVRNAMRMDLLQIP